VRSVHGVDEAGYAVSGPLKVAVKFRWQSLLMSRRSSFGRQALADDDHALTYNPSPCFTTGLFQMLLQALHDNLTTKRIINEEAEFKERCCCKIYNSSVPLLKSVHAATGHERTAIPCNVRLKSAAVASIF